MPRGEMLTKFPPISAGAHGDQAPHLLPNEASPPQFTKNVLFRDGWIVPRPGLTAFSTTNLADTPTGAMLYRQNNVDRVLIGTTHSWFLQSTTTPYTFTSLGAGLSGSLDNPNCFVEFPTGTPTAFWIIGVNGPPNHPYYWNGTTFGDLQSIASTAVGTVLPPAAVDITTAANRVILFNTMEGTPTVSPAPYNVRWCAFNDPTTWNGSDVAQLISTPDIIVGGCELNRVSFAIYKSDSQWLASAQAGLYPFAFEKMDDKPGPVSAHAILDPTGTGVHFYLGYDLDVYVFDGNQATSIGRPIQRFLNRNIQYQLRNRAFLIWERFDHNVWIFYPSVYAVSACDSAISYNIDSHQWFPHSLAFEVSTGTRGLSQPSTIWGPPSVVTTNGSTRQGTSASTLTEILARVDGSKVYAFSVDAVGDDNLGIACEWRTATVAPADWSYRSRVQSVESYFTQATATQPVRVALSTTDSLFSDPVTPASDPILTGSFDVSLAPSATTGAYELTADLAAPGIGSDGLAEARFCVLDHYLTLNSLWKWGGAALRTYKQETA